MKTPLTARVAALAERYPQLNIELVVAGLSPLRSQKCTNLLAALAQLDADDAYVVLLDADIRPQPWWLAMLVAPLAAGRADLVNGYRWPVPTRMSLGTVSRRRDRPCHRRIAAASPDQAGLGRFPRIHSQRPRCARSAEHDRACLDRGFADRRPRGESGLRVLTRRAIRPPTPARRQSSRRLALRAPAVPADPPLPPGIVVLRRLRRHYRPGGPNCPAVEGARLGPAPCPAVLVLAVWARPRPRLGWRSAGSSA